MKKILNKIKEFFRKLFKRKMEEDVYGIQIGNNKFDKFTQEQTDSFGMSNGSNQMDLNKLIAFEPHTTDKLDTWFKIDGRDKKLRFDNNRIVENLNVSLFKERTHGKDYGIMVKNKILHSDLKYFENQNIQVSQYAEQRKVKEYYGSWESTITVQHYLYVFEYDRYYRLSDIAQWLAANNIQINKPTNDFNWVSDYTIQYVDSIGKYALNIEIFVNRSIKMPSVNNMVLQTAY